MRPCSMLLSLRYGVSFLPELLWNVTGMSMRQILVRCCFIDNTFYPINTRLAAGQATHSLWQGFGLTWDDTSGEMHGYLSSVSLAQVNDVSC